MSPEGLPDGRRPALAFTVDAPLVESFFLLLQQGVLVRRAGGGTVDAFLREQLGASPESIERIQSVVLDGRPVDDIRATVIRGGATLALSAAMPGLVGATLRRGGAYSCLRSAITHREQAAVPERADGWVRIKLFNLVMRELGPGLLRGGVFVEPASLHALLAGSAPELWNGHTRVALDGREVAAQRLREPGRFEGADLVQLSVVPAAAG